MKQNDKANTYTALQSNTEKNIAPSMHLFRQENRGKMISYTVQPSRSKQKCTHTLKLKSHVSPFVIPTKKWGVEGGGWGTCTQNTLGKHKQRKENTWHLI